MNNIENFYSVINGFPVMQSCADEYMINKNHFEIINDNKVQFFFIHIIQVEISFA